MFSAPSSRLEFHMQGQDGLARAGTVRQSFQTYSPTGGRGVIAKANFGDAGVLLRPGHNVQSMVCIMSDYIDLMRDGARLPAQTTGIAEEESS